MRHQPHAGEADNNTVRVTEGGTVIGASGRLGCHCWLGIPYARPPLGKLRWKAPRPIQPWQGVREALRLASAAMQRGRVDGMAAASTVQGSEDCLYLNIWAPPMSAAEVRRREPGLPVMVWVHGGANVSGQGGFFDGSMLAMRHGVIVVTINYRLGVFGWFRHRALRDVQADPEDNCGNYGTLDILCALRWVQRNIAQFAGDAARVTVFGQSAGASNIYSLLVARSGDTPFARAIIQSGIPGSVSVAEAENYADEADGGSVRSSGELLIHLLINDGIAAGRAQAKQFLATSSDALIAEYLYSKQFADFDRAYRSIGARIDNASLRPGFLYPIADGTLLPAEGVEAALRTGRGRSDVPLIVGSNRDEFSILLLIYGTPFTVGFDAGRVLAVPNTPRFHLASQYLSALCEAAAVQEPAAYITAHARAPVFVYRFDWDQLEPVPWLEGIRLGSTHGLEVPFVFGHLELGSEFIHISLMKPAARKSYTRLSEQMMSYWAHFAHHGNPGCGSGGEQPEWKARGGDKKNCAELMFFGRPDPEAVLPGKQFVTRQAVLDRLRGDSRIGNERDRELFLCDLLWLAVPFALLNAADCRDISSPGVAAQLPATWVR